MTDKTVRPALFTVLLMLGLQGCATDPSATSAASNAAPEAPAAAASVPVADVVENAVSTALSPASRETVGVYEREGLILITGQVLSEAEKSAVSNAVAFAAGRQLRRLSNELRVVDQIDMASAASDAELATAANSLLASTDPALAEAVLAAADNARVFLVGRVSRAQGEQAAQVISRLQGVASVSTLFDYRD